ncbi:hypothetical protein TNCV_4042411 [Trichonephila clavipes]|nr:hypothetical protein TNCV_4042411 [Trichonephila clavipes]
MNCHRPVSGVEPIPICIGGALSRMTRCSIIEWCWEPHTAYRSPAGNNILLTVQKQCLVWTLSPKGFSPSSWRMDFTWGIFDKETLFDQNVYKLPPPTPAHVPAETYKRPLEQQPKPFSKKKRVVIAPVIRPSVPSVRIIKPSTALSTPQPVSIPEPPEQTTPQIPDPSL